MGGSNTELLFRIAGDPSGLKQALDQSQADVAAATSQMTSTVAGEAQKQVGIVNTTQQAMQQTIAESLKLQGVAADEVTQIYKKLGITGAQAAKEIGVAFGQSATEVQATSAAVSEAGQKGAQSFTETRLQAQLLSNELGLRLPRSITTLISHSEAMGSALKAAFPVLIAAFLVEEIIKIARAIAKASEEVMGYTENVKKAYEQDVKASEEAIRHFATIEEGNKRLAQTTKELGDIAQQTWFDRIHQGFLQADQDTSMLYGPLRGAILLYKTLGDSAAKAADEQVLALERLRAQQGQMIAVVEEQSKHELKMLDLQVKASAAGKGRADSIKLEISALEQKRQLEIKIAEEEAGQEALRSGGDVAALGKRRRDEINAEIDLQKKLLEGELAGIKVKVPAIHEYNDALEQQLQRTREVIEQITSGEMPAIQRIELEYSRQIDAANKEIAKDRELFTQKKLTRDQLTEREREYTALVGALADERAIKITQAADKETEALKKVAEGMKFSIPFDANLLRPFTDEFKQLTAAQRAALPTAKEYELILKNLTALLPNQTKEEIAQKAAVLSHNSALLAQITALQKVEGNSKALRFELEKLREEIYKLATGEKLNLGIMGSWKAALEEETEAIKQNMAAAVENVAKGIAGIAGGRRAEAVVESVFETAKGLQQVAMALDPYDPAHAAHWLSAAQHFVSATEFGIVAGQGAKASAGANVGGGSSGGQSGGSPGPLAAGAQGTTTPITPGLTTIGGQPSGSGATFHVIVMSPSDTGAKFASMLTDHVVRNGGQLIASRSVNPTKAGR